MMSALKQAMIRSSSEDGWSRRENSSWNSRMYCLRALRSTPRMSFFRRATAAFCRAISSRIRGGVGAGAGGLLDMTTTRPRARQRRSPPGPGARRRRPSVSLVVLTLLPLLPFVKGVLEVPDARAQTARELRDLLAAEDQEQDDKDEYQLGKAYRSHASHPQERDLRLATPPSQSEGVRGTPSAGAGRRRQDQTHVPLAPGHAGLIEVLQERDGVLAARAAQFLELGDVDQGVARLALPEPAPQILQGVDVEHLAVGDAHQPPAGHEQVE